MAESLFIFSLGPVQGFIAEARRAQDLWAGSTWLSQVASAALRVCQEDPNITLIYPGDPNQPSLPNRFVVRLPSEKVPALARACTEAAQQAFRKPADKAQKQLRPLAPTDEEWEELWERQFAHHLEIYWAAAPIDADAYPLAYQTAHRAFEAAKRVRRFAQMSEDGFKDSLGGKRSALRTAAKDARAYWSQVAEHYYPSILRPEGKERLDALGASKRFGFNSQRFPSVSVLAVAPFLRAAWVRCPELLRAHAKSMGDLRVPRLSPLGERLPALAHVSWPFEGDMFYPESLTLEQLREDYGISPPDEAIDSARKTLRELVTRVDVTPSRYYAILQMDGNSMGEHVWACKTQAQHAELSQQLTSFAGQVYSIVEQQHAGRVVYAGGDDVLALLPLAEAVPASCMLAETFDQMFRGWPKDALPKRDGTPVPFSVRAGLSIAHHRYPLSGALAEARAAEHKARDVPGKAALLVRVLIRSGSPVEASASWNGLKKQFEASYKLFAEDRISPRLAHNLAQEAPVFVAPGPSEAFRAEVRRLALRHRKRGKLNETEAAQFARDLMSWADTVGLKPCQVAAWLLIASFAARGGGAE